MISFLQQLRWELYRMFARRRTYIGFGMFVLVELIFFFLWTRPKAQEGMQKFIERVAGGFDEYFSALTIAFLMVFFTMLLMGLIFVSLVSGDIVAKESEDGNLRLLLVRPVSRFRLLIVKFLACQIYTFVLFLFVGTTALLVGLLDRGWGGSLFVWTPYLPRVSLFDWNEGMARFALAIVGFSLVYLPVTGMAFMFSCFRMKPAAATILTIAFFIADKILSSIPLPAFDPYRKYFISPKMESWLYLLYQDIPWPAFAQSCVWLLGFGLSAFIVGWIAFERRDVKG